MDFDNRKVYGDTSITDGLVCFLYYFFCISFLYLYLYSYLFLYYYWGDRACEASSASISALIDSFVERKTTSVLLLPVQISSFQYIMYTVYTSIKLTKARTDNGTPDVELKIHQQTNRYSPPTSNTHIQQIHVHKYTHMQKRANKLI